MGDWIAKLDDFLKLSGLEILTHAGTVSHDEALQKAHTEYERYRRERVQGVSRAERDFLEAVKAVESAGKRGGRQDA